MQRIGQEKRDRRQRRASTGVARLPRRSAALLGSVGAAIVLASIAGSTLLASRGEAQSGAGEARNVILFIGDGMGPPQRDMIQLGNVGPYEKLAMDSLPYEGMVGTNAADPETLVTDSAAAATSMASGIKTVNGAVGVDPEGNAVPTVLEQAKAAGKSTGLVTTSQVTDASPAAFASHVEDRDEQSEIARQYVEESRPDVILGGGEDRWYPEGEEGVYPDNPDEEDDPEVSQSDRGNLVAAAEGAGYEYVADVAGMEAAVGPKVLGLFANEEMFQQYPEGEGDVYDPVVPLPRMTEKALDVLSRNPNGFFLMVEEEAIDEMGHANNAGLQIKSGQAMDEAVAVATEYAEASGDTLLITTADHECCGQTVEALDDPEEPDENGAEIPDNLSGEDGPFDVANSDYQFVVDATATNHTAVDVPLTAFGPGAELLTGNYENTYIYEVMAGSLGVAGTSAAAGISEMPETGGATPEELLSVPSLPLAGLIGASALLASALLALRHRLRGSA